MMKNQRPRAGILGLLFLAIATLAGCRAPEPESPAAGLTGSVVAPQPPDLGRGASRATFEGGYNMYVGEPVRKACSGTAPFFEFDSSSARDIDQPTMHSLADCMLTGPLKGKTIKLIGHTDPRGTPTYNQRLGFERAERVKSYLVARGVDAGRVEVGSVGEDEASPAPKDWATDRRVEIQLVR